MCLTITVRAFWLRLFVIFFKSFSFFHSDGLSHTYSSNKYQILSIKFSILYFKGLVVKISIE